jgi:hypothetical protein
MNGGVVSMSWQELALLETTCQKHYLDIQAEKPLPHRGPPGFVQYDSSGGRPTWSQFPQYQLRWARHQTQLSIDVCGLLIRGQHGV